MAPPPEPEVEAEEKKKDKVIGEKKSCSCCDCIGYFCLILFILLLVSVAGVVVVWYMNYFDVHELVGSIHSIAPYKVEIEQPPEPVEPEGPQPI